MKPPHFLDDLRDLILSIPITVPEAGDTDILAEFSRNPANLLPEDSVSAEDLWEEVVNRKLHSVFWGKAVEEIESIIRRGEKGVSGICGYIAHCVDVRGVQKELFDEKVDILSQAIRLM